MYRSCAPACVEESRMDRMSTGVLPPGMPITIFRAGLNMLPNSPGLLPVALLMKPVSIFSAALLHDTCKSDIYKSAIVSRKNDAGYWEKCPGYQVDYSDLPSAMVRSP